jgi:hypothetical protein
VFTGARFVIPSVIQVVERGDKTDAKGRGPKYFTRLNRHLTIKNAVFWHGRVALVRDDAFLHSVLRLMVTANVVPGSPILVSLMMEALRSSETSVLACATRRKISDDGHHPPNGVFVILVRV